MNDLLRETKSACPYCGTGCGVIVQARGDRIDCTVDSSEKRLPDILKWLCDRAVLVRDCQVREPDLEEVFVELSR